MTSLARSLRSQQSSPRKVYTVELVTQEEVQQALRGYDPSVFPAWVLALNSWRWPEDCPIPCPRGWDDAPSQLKMAMGKALWISLHQQTTEEEISRLHWTQGMGKTEAEWEAWWTHERLGSRGEERGA